MWSFGSCGQIGEECELSCGASAHCGQIGEDCELSCGASAHCGQVGEECEVQCGASAHVDRLERSVMCNVELRLMWTDRRGV